MATGDLIGPSLDAWRDPAPLSDEPAVERTAPAPVTAPATDEIGVVPERPSQVPAHTAPPAHTVPVEHAAPMTVGSAVGVLWTAVRSNLTDLRPSLDRRTALKLVGQGISVVGVLFLALALFEGVLGSMTERRDQRALRGAFEGILESQGGFAPVAGDGIIPPGTPVATIEIPKLGLAKVVVEGTTSDDLRRGPGHLRSTPLPGQHGNAVIAGRRTTYGGPFRDLDSLVAGDEVLATTPFGEFRYVVTEVASLEPGDPDRLGPTARPELTLTTSDPVYRATRRLVVVAKLRGETSSFPDPLRQAKVGIDEAAFFGDAGKAVLAIVLTFLVLASLSTARALYGRWRRWPTYLLTTPVVGAVTFAWLETMVALLPSTL